MIEKTTRRLPVELTAEERASKALQLAEVVQTIDLTEGKAKDSAAGFKEKIKLLELDKSLLAGCVRTGKEYRSVDIYEKQNLTLRTWEVRRADTQEMVESRPMSDYEYREATQEKLPFTTFGARVEVRVPKPAEKPAASNALADALEPVTTKPLKPLTATVQELVDEKVCSNKNCGKPIVGISRKGRCRPCADFLRRHGAERHLGATVVDRSAPGPDAA